MGNAFCLPLFINILLKITLCIKITYKFRLYPSKEQEQKLLFILQEKKMKEKFN
ncbi:helix-turn-helix domain-containing protein [Candidatus Micrarchaeota archaeon]|nr:helix-turn-helix domain-containing protein [Candidatus Micrarchaeota archaeon]